MFCPTHVRALEGCTFEINQCNADKYNTKGNLTNKQTDIIE